MEGEGDPEPGAVRGVRRQGLGLALQRPRLRGMQGILPQVSRQSFYRNLVIIPLSQGRHS